MKKQKQVPLRSAEVIKSVLLFLIFANLLILVNKYMPSHQVTSNNIADVKFSVQIVLFSVTLYWLFYWLPHLYRNMLYFGLGLAGLLLFLMTLFSKGLVESGGASSDLAIILKFLFMEKVMLFIISMLFIIEGRKEMEKHDPEKVNDE